MTTAGHPGTVSRPEWLKCVDNEGMTEFMPERKAGARSYRVTEAI